MIYKNNIKYKITSPFGNRTLNGQAQYHAGIDFVGIGTKDIVSVCDGTVKSSTIITNKSDLTWQWGNYIRIDDNNGNSFYYCHLSSRKSKVGDKIKKGDVIGVEGNTGYSFGSHCHFEMRTGGKAVIPCNYLGIDNKVGTYDVTDIGVGNKVVPTWDWYVKKVDGDMVEISSKTGKCKVRCQAKNVEKVEE